MLKMLSSRRSLGALTPSGYVHQNEILRMCKKCYSFNYANGWYFEKPAYLSLKDPEEEISVQFSMCPACSEEELANTYDVELFRVFMNLKNRSYDNWKTTS